MFYTVVSSNVFDVLEVCIGSRYCVVGQAAANPWCIGSPQSSRQEAQAFYADDVLVKQMQPSAATSESWELNRMCIIIYI